MKKKPRTPPSTSFSNNESILGDSQRNSWEAQAGSRCKETRSDPRSVLEVRGQGSDEGDAAYGPGSRLARGILAAATVLGLCVFAAPERPRSQTRSPTVPDAKNRPVLHEYVDPPAPSTGPKFPAAPSARSRRDPGEPMYNRSADRETKIGADRDTIHRGDLNYHASYDPTVVPFKRFSTTDKVGADFTLTVSDATLRRIPVRRWAGATGRELFWGSFLVNGNETRPVPVPSVAPDMQIHKVISNPGGFYVQFLKDGADNYFLQLQGSAGVRRVRRGRRARTLSRPVRVLALVSASKTYFGGELPAGPWKNELSPIAPKLPPNVARSAHQVLAYIGVKTSDALPASLRRLVRYFRDFRQGRMTLNTGISYLDLALSQRGVCRHRSYAFVITAQALGLPARYVSNEAHAFVEVFLPRNGWRRIDLGGATPRLNVHNARKKRPHRPRPDPFPRPKSYMQTHGLNAARPYTAADPGAPKDPSGPDRNAARRRFKSLMSGSSPGTWVDAKSLGLKPDPSSPSTDPVTANPTDPGALPTLPMVPPGKTMEVGQISVVSSGVRGRPLKVSGTITDPDGPVNKLRVVVLAYRRGDEGAVVLGEALTDPAGRFRLSGAVPSEIPVGFYHIYAFAPSQAGRQPAISR